VCFKNGVHAGGEVSPGEEKHVLGLPDVLFPQEKQAGSWCSGRLRHISSRNMATLMGYHLPPSQVTSSA
jgi:hypothetical protein